MLHNHKIRKARQNDAIAIRHVQMQTWLATYPNKKLGITNEIIKEKDFENPAKVLKMTQTLRRSDITAWVALNDGHVVAYAIVETGNKLNKLGALYVLPEYQGNGIGSKLMGKALNFLGDGKAISLGVTTYNTKTIEWYKKFGFHVAKPVVHLSPTFPSGVDMPEVEMVLRAKIT